MVGTVLDPVLRSLWMATVMFWDTLWPLVLGFALSGAVQAFVSRERMQSLLGDRRPRTLALATAFGVVSSSCSYAASAMAKSLFRKGADFTSAMVFMLASTNLVLELGLVLWILVGWQFAVAEYVGGALMIGLLALVARFAFPAQLVDAARRRLDDGGHGAHAGHGEQAGGPSRIRSLGGWADAAAYAIADLNMLRRELVIGYLVAGALTVLVPSAVWSAVFFRGHGAWTSVENVLVGPFIAVVSFVCSVGNVPLAAALWAGGLSFGGVVSFVFADLITLPLLLIYRKFYGLALTLRLAAAFWLVMSAAGLVTELLFGAVGWVPAGRPQLAIEPRIEWNYTTWLNLVGLALFAGLVWLARNQSRLGGGAGYALDPVCGMQVNTALAPAHAVHRGVDHWFCSDHCRERFEAAPYRYATGGRLTTMPAMQPAGPEATDTALDPVCGMTVDRQRPGAVLGTGASAIYFCSEGCAQRYTANPAAFSG